LNLIAREWLNAGLIPLTACIIIIISFTLIDAYRAHGKGWTKVPGVKSACAFWWIFVADLIRACMAWAYLNAQNDGRELATLSSLATILYLVAAIIASLATFRLIHALSPTSWGHKGWVSAAILTVAFMVGLGLFA
jgi:hypothetical protein